MPSTPRPRAPAQGSADFQGAPAFADGVAYVPWAGGLRAVDARSWAGRWSSSVGGLSGEAPLVSAGHVYAGSSDGYVVALRRSDGVADWCASTAGEPVGTGTGNVDRPDSGLGAGGNRLLVPAGRFLVAYGPGGATPAPCGPVPAPGAVGGGGSSAGAVGGSPGTGATGGSSTGTATPSGPSLTLLPARRNVIAGRRLRLDGRLSGAPAVASQAVVVEADAWPFDGRWRRRGSTTTAADGSWTLSVRPGRNTRYRALAAGLTSAEVPVYADLLARFRRRLLGGGRFRETFVVRGPRSVRLAAKRAHFYLMRKGARRARRARSVPLRRVRAGVYSASATLHFLGSPRRTVVLACYRERTPDPWGRPATADRACGARRLTLAQPARAAAADATARFVQRGG